jgi:sortase A
VEETRIADSRSAWIGSTQDQAQLMMVTCYPFDAVQPGGPLRYVVTARADVAPS